MIIFQTLILLGNIFFMLLHCSTALTHSVGTVDMVIKQRESQGFDPWFCSFKDLKSKKIKPH